MIDNPFGIPADVWARMLPVEEAPSIDGEAPRSHGAARDVCEAACCNPTPYTPYDDPLRHNSTANLGISDLVPTERWDAMTTEEKWRYMP